MTFRKKAEERGKKVEEKLGKILDAKQMERLKQLQMQSQGVQALTNADVVAKLKLSKDAARQDREDHRRSAAPISRDLTSAMQRTTSARRSSTKCRAVRGDHEKSALKVLDDDQLVEWGTMVGKEFKFEGGMGFGFGGRRGSGGGRGGGGNNPPPQNN